MRDIRIEPALNGWIVYVGCSRVVFQDDINKLLRELQRYIQNPDLVEREYINNSPNTSTSDAPELPTLAVAPEPDRGGRA
jgi:hypothetical protein